ncbi:MAG: hypothetical protein L0Y79_04750 [Chlorobi bacterium]|nr:hypothetical protein [Chlorobiota bacterium]MCI0716808.1 hypothetical protein [Chlorobiota bacterium]
MEKNYGFRKTAIILFSLIILLSLFLGNVFHDGDADEDKEVVKLMTEETGEEEEYGPPDTVMIGVYVFSVYDLDFPGNKVNADFYVWYNAKNDSLELLQYFELVNSVEFTKSGETDEKRGDIVYQTVRINSRIKKSWDVSNFPFDKQTVELVIEDFDKDNTKLVFVADTTGSKIDKEVHIEGWKVYDFGIKVVDHTYETSYGDPAIPIDEYSAYSRVIVYFTIEREGKGLFFKLFLGLFISVLISLLTFFVNPMDLDPRFGLSVGAIFAAIASQYVISSTLPQNESLTLVDILHDVSFIFIFMCILASTISLHYMKNGKKSLSQKIDRYGFFILSFLYVILAIFFVTKSLN